MANGENKPSLGIDESVKTKSMDVSLLDKFLITLAPLLIAIVVGTTTVFFLINKNYDFIIELPCDSSAEACFQRDCSDPDACPPNNLETYREFVMPASFFDSCSFDSCQTACLFSSNGICEEIVCGEDSEDECFIQEKHSLRCCSLSLSLDSYVTFYMRK